MEQIAHSAGIAKPTLYGQFGDKEAVLQGIATLLAGEIGSAFDEALHRDGNAAERLGRALAAKYRLLARRLGGSRHADELYGEAARGAFRQLAALEHHIETSMERELGAAGVLRPRQVAQLLLAAAEGVARRAAAGEVGPAIRLLTERLVRPEFGP